jgi:hypothetical protein
VKALLVLAKQRNPALYFPTEIARWQRRHLGKFEDAFVTRGGRYSFLDDCLQLAINPAFCLGPDFGRRLLAADGLNERQCLRDQKVAFTNPLHHSTSPGEYRIKKRGWKQANFTGVPVEILD